VPRYLVNLTQYPLDQSSESPLTIKLIDFGQAFTLDSKPETLEHPLHLTAPELALGQEFDHRTDLWSAGCLIFQLFDGQPPFKTNGTNERYHMEEIRALLCQAIPERWQSAWEETKKRFPTYEDEVSDCDSNSDPTGTEKLSLRGFLERYSSLPLSAEDLDKLVSILDGLLTIDPENRVEAAELLEDEWWDK
ncbi:kinase-like protein, partial [Periconia macrospinosa]